MIKCRLMSPQWIGIQEKAAGNPREIRHACHTSNEDAKIVLDDKNKTLMVRHDPAMIVPVINVNPCILNHQDISASFCINIQDH